MKLIRNIIFLILLLLPCSAGAQFYVTGDDPGSLKWRSMDTDSYRIIYPKGTDSLARVYASQLEKYKIPVSRTTGYLTGQGDGKLMPVVMHAYNTSNGSVAWAPKRMDLFTIPSAYNPEPIPWPTMLALHESRHVTQMQFGMTRTMKPFNYVFGEMFNILVSLVYQGMYFIEGDAVIAETALTKSGRGRTADFLNYYMAAFDQGDYRSFPRWLYGSQRHYTPNHYALGYMTLGGIRYLYDYPNILEDAYDRASRTIFDFSPTKTFAKRKAGAKNFKQVFETVRDTMKGIWTSEIEARAPFISGEPVTASPRLYTDYKDNVAMGSDIYSIKSGFLTTPVLVRIDSTGREHKVSRFASQTSVIKPSEGQGRLYWSETLADERWSMKTDSRIRYIEPLRSSRKRNLTDRKNLLFNPTPSEDEFKVATVQYYPEGGSSLVVKSTYEGGASSEIHAPDSVQLLETAWIGDDVYVTGLSEGGYGIYLLPEGAKAGKWQTVLGPQPVIIKDFKAYGNELIFACDRTGVHELYHFNPSTGDLRQKTSTRYGASDFTYSTDGRWLYYSSQTLKGMQMYRTSVDSLLNRPADFSDIHKYIIADRLSEQEKAAAEKAGFSEAVPEVDYTLSQPKKYSKLGHAFNIHSWAPVYVSVDNIMNMSFDHIWQAASLGIAGIMQNRLATGVGEFGYSAHKDPYNPSKWRHSGHAKFTYSGLYPVIEASIDVNDRAARQYNVTGYTQDGRTSVSLSSKELPSPYVEGRLSMYIPFNFSSGGWHRGVVPKVSYSISNDMFNTSAAIMSNDGIVYSDNSLIGFNGTYYLPSGNPVLPTFIGATKGKNTFRHSLSGSIRAYTMLGTPNSAVYPKWGIGLEAGAAGSLESSQWLSPMGYAYLYGYVPGIVPAQGLKLSAMTQVKLSPKTVFGQAAVNVLPRGLSKNTALLQQLSVGNNLLTKVSADYAIPVYIGDISIAGGLLYIKRLTLTPHFDYMFVGRNNPAKVGLFSVGSAFTLDLNGLIWINWPCSFGVTYSYNGGPSFNAFREAYGITLGRHYVGPVFNVSF